MFDVNMESELWQGPPEAPDAISTDLSCQGVIVTTLHQALNDIRQNELLNLDDDASGRILQSFGEAVVNSYRNPDLPQGPALRLTGRLEHHNRYQSKWRLVVDETQLNPITETTYSKKPQPAQKDSTSTSNIRLEILAHNDI